MCPVEILDYDPANPNVELQDPTTPDEVVMRSLMDKLAKAFTRFEELLLSGDPDMTISDLQQFMAARGDALDWFDDPEIAVWLKKMRESARCPHRRFSVRG